MTAVHSLCMFVCTYANIHYDDYHYLLLRSPVRTKKMGVRMTCTVLQNKKQQYHKKTHSYIYKYISKTH